MPSSSSHALIGGVLGAVTISYGTGAINGNGVFMIVAGLIGSPVIAMFSGYVIMTLLFILFRNVGRSKVNYISLHIQSLSAAVMAFSHGSNDAQKCMGIITLALLSGGYIGELEVPFLVKIACAFAMCAGTSVGGWRIIRTVGNKIFRLEPVNGLAADINSALTISRRPSCISPYLRHMWSQAPLWGWAGQSGSVQYTGMWRIPWWVPGS